MHDPLTVAFEIRNPFARRYSWGNRWKDRPSLATIWHKDPCKDGTDNSCDWHGTKGPLLPTEKAIAAAVWDLETLLDNRPHFPDSPEHKAWQPLHRAITLHLARKRRRFFHPRWHVWHWRIQIPAWQAFNRWAFSRCCKCGGRFRWGYAPCSDSWNGEGPRFLRGELGVYHASCSRPEWDGACAAAPREGTEGQ